MMGVPDSRPIDVGRIDYTNTWPLFHYVPDETEDYRIVRRVPSGLNRMLQEGKLAVSAVSSFIYGMDPQSYALLPGLSVGTVGRVRSLLLFLKKPLREALRGRIALTDTSATTINLLKIILALRYDGNPQYTVMQPDLEAMLEENDAALLIGDSAIRASWTDHGLEVMDLGQEWHEWTGLGMTYAVVAARRDALASRPDEVLHLHRDLLDSRRRSVADPEPLVQRAAALIGGSPAYWREYFSAIRYDFGPELREGLELYYRYAHQLGLIGEPASLAFIDPQLSTGR